VSTVLFRTAGLLVLSNVFMAFAWYAHLRNLGDRPWFIAALARWGIALLEYLPGGGVLRVSRAEGLIG